VRIAAKIAQHASGLAEGRLRVDHPVVLKQPFATYPSSMAP
jgi:hypothetical protein